MLPPPAGSLQTLAPSRVALQVMTDFEAGCCGSGCKARAGHGNQIGRTAAFIACRPVIAPATPEPLLCLAAREAGSVAWAFGERGKAANVDEQDRNLALAALRKVDSALPVHGMRKRRQQRRHLKVQARRPS